MLKISRVIPGPVICALAVVWVLNVVAQEASTTPQEPSASPAEAKPSPAVPAEKEPISPKLQKSVNKIFSLGMSYYRRGKYEEALSAFQIALSFDPGNKKIEEYVNAAQDKIGEILLSKERAKKEIEENKLKKRIYDLYAAGLYAMRYKRYDDAIAYFQEVLKLSPRHQGAWTNIVDARTELERERKEVATVSVGEPEVRPQAVTRIAKEPLRKPPVIERPVTREEPVPVKETQLAKGHLPETGVPAASEAEIIKEREKRKRALIEQEQRGELENMYSYAQKLLKLGRYEEAETEFQKVEGINPDYRQTKYYLADIFKVKESERREKEPLRYTLGGGDVIELNVLAHEELSGSVTVQPGGEIILPALKEVVMANGLTKEELAEKIKETLVKYVKEPEVRLVITGYYSKKWYILGEVAVKGEYPLGKTDLTLMEALYQAGLPVEGIAAMRRVILIKPHKTHPRYKPINVFDILYYGRMQENVRIEPGDIIYVPKTVLAKVTNIISQISAPVTATKTTFEDLVDASTAARAATPLKKILGPTTKDGDRGEWF